MNIQGYFQRVAAHKNHQSRSRTLQKRTGVLEHICCDHHATERGQRHDLLRRKERGQLSVQLIRHFVRVHNKLYTRERRTKPQERARAPDERTPRELSRGRSAASRSEGVRGTQQLIPASLLQDFPLDQSKHGGRKCGKSSIPFSQISRDRK